MQLYLYNNSWRKHRRRQIDVSKAQGNKCPPLLVKTPLQWSCPQVDVSADDVTGRTSAL